MIAGCILNGMNGRAHDKASYFVRISGIRAPIDERPVASMAVMNVLDERSVLEDCAPYLMTKGCKGTSINPLLAQRGIRLLRPIGFAYSSERITRSGCLRLNALPFRRITSAVGFGASCARVSELPHDARAASIADPQAGCALCGARSR